MDEEDDDLYGPAGTAAPHSQPSHSEEGDSGDEPMDEGLESGEEDDSDDSDDSDIKIIIDRPQEPVKPAQQTQPQESKAIKIEQPTRSTNTPSQTTKSNVPVLPTQLGATFPAQRTSTIDVDADPIFPPLQKPITNVDIDADLAEHSKPWRIPGADPSDYFNYGFDEFTWEMYRQRQQTMATALTQQKAETAELQQFFGPGPGAVQSGPNAPAGPAASGPGSGAGGQQPAGMATSQMAPGAGGMPTEDQMMQMMQQMMQQGIDPNSMDFGQFMQMAGPAMGGFPGPADQSATFGGVPAGGQGRGGAGGGRRGGRGRGW